jgi:glucose/mannose transport system permease protein
MKVPGTKRFSTKLGGLLFVLPSIIAVAVFVYGMILWTLNISLSNRTSGYVEKVEYIGLKNYTDLVVDERFTHALSNLVKFTVTFMLATLLAGFVMSLLLEKGIKGEGFFRSFYLYPMAISFIAMGTAFRWLFFNEKGEDAAGLNLLLRSVGLGFLQNDWILSENGAMYSMAIPAIWQMSGYVMALFLAGFRGIPDEMREAARVDGATEFQIYRQILFPQLTPTILTIFIILGHVSMKMFDLIVGINGKSYGTQVVAVYMWEATFDAGNQAKGTAISVFILVMVALVVVPYLRHVNKQEAYR